MAKFLLGKKIGMTQLFTEDGNVVPVTLIAAGPITVTQLKTADKDGYVAVQVGFGQARNMKKTASGHARDHGKPKFLREFRGEAEGFQQGSVLNAAVFAKGDLVSVRGLSKGKGFAGVVKRHGFRGGWASHGAKHSLRQPGSIGASWPERVRRGTRMAGRMGHVNATVQNLEVVHIDADKNILALKGSVPGSRGTLLEIRSSDKSEIRPARKRPEPKAMAGGNPKSETNSNVRKQK